MSSPIQSPEPPRPSRTLRGWLIRGSAALAALVLVLWMVWQNTEIKSWPVRGRPRMAEIVSSTAPGTASPARLAAAPADALNRVEPCIARIEADGPGGLEVIGSGFVVAPQGLLATSYHVAAQATQAVARFRDGRVHEIAGYAALDRENDVALLRLRAATELTAVELYLDDPAPLTTVFAVGHPHGIEFSPFDGKVSRIVTTSQLPAATQRFVRELTGSQRDHRWIQHTANLSDGNSGGPLVDEVSRVIGINTWVDRQTGFGYALPAGAIAALQDRPLAETEPLERHATSEARLKAQLWQTSAQQLTTLYDEARAMRWQPASRRDYARLQQLAFGITLANRPAHFGGQPALGERFDELVKSADQVVAQLRREKWNDAGQITLLNEFAAAEVNRPLAGLILIGTVERIVSGPATQNPANRGKLAAIIVLAGFEQRLLVPLDSGLNAPEPGSQCLILGVNDRGRVVHYGDNPLDPIAAPVLITGEIIAL